LYDGSGAKFQVLPRVTIPGTPIGSPTGIVFNGSSDFAVTPGNPAFFIFAALDGTISAWNPSVNFTMAIQKVPGSNKSVLTGATIAQIGDDRFLYVADLEAGKITVYDTDFGRVELNEEAFDDDRLPPGFAPFNVQNIGNNLYVAYAKQNKSKTFIELPSRPGQGFVDVFSPADAF
jgi:uncharacterized protein (TIGR03118 family)